MRFLEPSPADESAAVGAGVEAASETLSLPSGTFSMEVSSTAATGDEATEGVDCSSDFGVGSAKRRRIFGDSLSMTIFSSFLLLSVAEGDLPGVLEGDMVVGVKIGRCSDVVMRLLEEARSRSEGRVIAQLLTALVVQFGCRHKLFACGAGCQGGGEVIVLKS